MTDENKTQGEAGKEHRATPSAESQATGELSAAPAFAVGDRVAFADERGTRRESYVTAIVPVGNYSATELGYAIRGSYGDYVRVAADIELLLG